MVKRRFVVLTPHIALVSLMILADAGAMEVHHGNRALFHYGIGDEKDPNNIALVKSEVERVGFSFDGCELTTFLEMSWIIGVSYKVKYKCNVDGEEKVCTFHFREKPLNIKAILFPEYPSCVVTERRRHTTQKPTRRTTTESPTTEQGEETSTDYSAGEETTTDSSAGGEATTDATLHSRCRRHPKRKPCEEDGN